MKRNCISTEFSAKKSQELIRQIAFHESGHAAAIHFNNAQQQLPPVYYKITIKEMSGLFDFPINPYNSIVDNCIAKVEGGRLIHTLPVSILKSNKLTKEEIQAYRIAYETDIVNLFIGPLAEAKYIARRDNELFNASLVNVYAMKYYGGTSDIDTAHDYLNCCYDNQPQRTEKINELFNCAHRFINNAWHWKAISALANYISASKNTTISCEQANQIMETSIHSRLPLAYADFL